MLEVISQTHKVEIRKQIWISLNGVDEEVWVNKDVILAERFKDRILVLNTTYKDNKFNDPEYVEELESMIYEDQNLYNIYVLGLWGKINAVGLIYKSYDDKLNLCDYVCNPMLPISVCCDFNIDPMKWALIQTVGGVDYVFDEIVMVDTRTEKMVKELIKRYPVNKHKFYIYGDYSGTFRHTSSPATDYEIIKKYIPTLADSDICIQPNPYVIERIDTMNWRLCNKSGLRRLKVAEHCVNTRYDLRNATYVKGKREEDKSNEKYDGKNVVNATIHITSAIGYKQVYDYSIKGKPKISHGQAK